MPVEVRQCPKCQQPALLLVNEWRHSVNGANTNEVTREYRCQSCGAWQEQGPKSRLIAWWIVGVLLAPTCIGLPFLWLAWRMQTFDKRVPVVPGTPEPRLRYPGGPPKRTCAHCQGVAVARNITRHTHQGVPTGTEYEYECTGCKRTFSTENVLGSLTSGFGALVLLGIGAAFFFSATSAGWKWGGGLGLAGLGVFLGVQTGGRVVNRFKHAPVQEHVL